MLDTFLVCFVTQTEESFRCQFLGPKLCNVLGKRQQFRVRIALHQGSRAQSFHASAEFIKGESSSKVRLNLDDLGLKVASFLNVF